MNRLVNLNKANRVLFPVLLIALSACDDSPTSPEISEQAALLRFESCEALEQYIEDTAVRQMKLEIDNIHESYGRGGASVDGDGDFGGPEAPTANGGEADDGGSDSEAPEDYTGTNNQVAGVEEPDFVKNDGTRIFVVSGQNLYSAKSWPAADMELSGKLAIEGWPREMFLDAERDRVVVISTLYGEGGYYYGIEPGGAVATDIACFSPDCRPLANLTKLTVVDVSDLSAPKAIAETYLPGGYSKGRGVGSTVRIVLSDYFSMPEGLRYYPDELDGGGGDVAVSDGVTKIAAELDVFDALGGDSFDQLKEENEQLIRARELADWLPKATYKRENGDAVELGYRCGDFYQSSAPVNLGLTTVVTLDVENPDSVGRTSIVAEAQEVYASTESLYIANAHWWWTAAAGQSTHTYIHKFDISDANETTYVATGGVDGYLLNQFAMDEFEGRLRVATTIDTNVEDSEQPWRTLTTNRVSVLSEDEGKLVVVGRTEDVAEGERIYSARFIGDKGFLVTFRQIDPLFTVDLSDPTSPEVVGELKVPGYSSYIHPLDENHLLTIGVDIPEDGGWPQQVKLTVFDVSDFANPQEKFTKLVGTVNGSTEAVYNHLAFNYFADEGLLAIPFQDYEVSESDPYSWEWSNFTSDVRVFRINVESGITTVGALSFTDVYEANGQSDFAWYYSPAPRRSIMASDDDGHVFVYGIADSGIRVADLSDLDAPLSTVTFDVYDPEVADATN